MDQKAVANNLMTALEKIEFTEEIKKHLKIYVKHMTTERIEKGIGNLDYLRGLIQIEQFSHRGFYVNHKK